MEEMWLRWMLHEIRSQEQSPYSMRLAAIGGSSDLFHAFMEGLLTIEEVYRIYWGLQLR